MALTLPTNWQIAFADQSQTMVWLIQIEVGVRVHHTVQDYTQGGTDTVTVNHTPSGGGTSVYTVTEGTDFDAVTSDEQTAANIAAALRAVLPTGVLCYSRGTRVTTIAPDGDTLTNASSDVNAWDLTPGIDVVGTLSAVSGSEQILGFPPIVSSVGKVGVEIDPVTRHLPRPDNVKVVIADNGPGDVVRLWMSTYPDLRGKTATIKLGWPGASTVSDFVSVGTYRITKVLPVGRTPALRLELRETTYDLDNLKIRPNVIHRHPLEAIAEIFETADRANGYVSAGLDPSNYSDIGHWAVSRGAYLRDLGPRGEDDRPENPGTWPEEQNALTLLNGALELLDGTFAQNESGQYSFSRQAHPAVSADYTLDEVTDFGDFGQAENLPPYNECTVSGLYDVGGTTELIKIRNENSRDQHGAVGGPTTYGSLKVTSPWVGGLGLSVDYVSATDGVGTIITLVWVGANGFSGLRRDTEPTPGSAPSAFPYGQDSNTDCTAARPIYLMFFDTEEKTREIMRFESAAMGFLGAAKRPDSVSGTWNMAEVTLAARALYGTTAQAWDVSASTSNGVLVPNNEIRILDITPAVQAAERKLSRLADGVPVVEFSTSLRHYGMQIGETVKLLTDRYVDFGQDGMDSGSAGIFEIVRKEVTERGVSWKAVLLSYNRTTPYTPVPIIPVIPVRIPTFESEYSASFDGSNDYADAGSWATLDGADRVWWQGWVKLDTPADTDVILSRFDSGNEQFEISLRSGSTANRYELRLDLGTGHHTATTDEPLVKGVWYNLALFYDGSAGTTSIYINSAKRTTTASGAIPATLGTGGGSNLRFAGRSDGTNHWHGLLDEWAMGYEASTMDEDEWALQWFGRGRPGDMIRMVSAPDPAHWWRFENDWRGRYGAHLTPSGGPFFSGDVAANTFVSNRTALLDGSDDDVHWGAQGSWGAVTQATWSFWGYFPTSIDPGDIIRRGIAAAAWGGFNIRVDSGGKVNLELGNGASFGAAYTAAAAFVADTWAHVVVTYNAGTVVIYVDGASVSVTNVGIGAIASMTAPNAGDNLTLTSSSNRVGAYVGNVAYWIGAVATAAQATEIYNAGTPPDLETLPTLAAPDWWVTLDGTWAPRVGSGTPTLAGSVAFTTESPP